MGLTLREGALAGVAAGLIASAPELVNVRMTDATPWTSVRTIGTVFGYPPGSRFAVRPVVLGGALHLSLSALYGMAFTAMIARRRAQCATTVRGTLFGAAIYAANFGVVTRHPRFHLLRQNTTPAVEVPAHLLFGVALALILCRRAHRLANPTTRSGIV